MAFFDLLSDYLGKLWNILNSNFVILVLGFFLINITWNELKERNKRKNLQRALRNEIRSIEFIQKESSFLPLSNDIWTEMIKSDIISDFPNGLQSNLFTLYTLIANKNFLINQKNIHAGAQVTLVMSANGEGVPIERVIGGLTSRINERLKRVIPAIEQFVN